MRTDASLGTLGRLLYKSWVNPAHITSFPALRPLNLHLTFPSTLRMVYLAIATKLGTPVYPDNLCVARPVGKAEI